MYSLWLYSGTSLGGTTRGTLEGYPGQVLSAWYQSSRFLNSLGLYIVVRIIQCLYAFLILSLETDSVHLLLETVLLPDGAQR